MKADFLPVLSRSDAMTVCMNTAKNLAAQFGFAKKEVERSKEWTDNATYLGLWEGASGYISVSYYNGNLGKELLFITVRKYNHSAEIGFSYSDTFKGFEFLRKEAIGEAAIKWERLLFGTWKNYARTVENIRYGKT